MTALYLGLGCRRGCPARTLETLLRQTFQAHGLQLGDLAGLASIDLKHDEPGLHALAQQLGLPLWFYPAAELAVFETRLSHRSTIAFAHSGCYGVAESAALALAERAQPGPARLLLPRCLAPQASLAVACTARPGG